MTGPIRSPLRQVYQVASPLRLHSIRDRSPFWKRYLNGTEKDSSSVNWSIGAVIEPSEKYLTPFDGALKSEIDSTDSRTDSWITVPVPYSPVAPFALTLSAPRRHCARLSKVWSFSAPAPETEVFAMCRRLCASSKATQPISGRLDE